MEAVVGDHMEYLTLMKRVLEEVEVEVMVEMEEQLHTIRQLVGMALHLLVEVEEDMVKEQMVGMDIIGPTLHILVAEAEVDIFHEEEMEEEQQEEVEEDILETVEMVIMELEAEVDMAMEEEILVLDLAEVVEEGIVQAVMVFAFYNTICKHLNLRGL